ncbi:GNAT family N-acetyltransferase [Agromyces sp. SYSU T0242]|uniref:GNAT family N-acetyltransferase n=1 Tax=Agromyces litoreus TaxID=3158561 RepID=UPI0033976242
MSRTTGAPPRRGARVDVRRLVRDLVPQRPRFLRGPRIEDGVRSPVIRTERLTLRPHRMADAAAWYELQSDPDVVEHLAWPLRGRAESFVHLLNRTRHTRLEQRDDFLALAVVLDGELIGDASLHLRELEPERRRCDVGWVIGPRWQGRGYAREAGLAMLELAFDTLGAATVQAHMAPANRASLALAERLGFSEGEPSGGDRVMVLDRARYRSLHDGDETAATS